MTMQYADAPIAHNVNKLDEILGFRIRGQAKVDKANGNWNIAGAQTQLLQQIDNGKWIIRAAQPATPREFLMYTLLLEMWEHECEYGDSGGLSVKVRGAKIVANSNGG